jgi:hypothetical protein
VKAAHSHIANVKAKTLRETIVKVASRKSYLATDELASYETIGKEFSGQGTVRHSADEYVRLGGFSRVPFQPYETRGIWHAPFDQRSPFAALPRGMGFQVEHPQRQRAALALKGAEGKRLTYRRPRDATHA